MSAFHELFAAFATAVAPAVPVVEAANDFWTNLLIAVSLLIVALVLLALEFFIASGGAIAIGALVSGAAAIAAAFAAGNSSGWLFVVLTPLLGVIVLRWGLRRLQQSNLVTQAEITGDAGYRHAAELIGVAIGSVGELVTDAFPTGRARFAGKEGSGELDVVVRGTVLKRGDQVVVKLIEGPTVVVAAAPPPSPVASESSSPKEQQ